MPLKPATAMRKDKTTAKYGVTMQHRHFAFIANSIANLGATTETKQRVANRFAVDLAATNSNFDRARFFTACGVDDPVITEAIYQGPERTQIPGIGKTAKL